MADKIIINIVFVNMLVAIVLNIFLLNCFSFFSSSFVFSYLLTYIVVVVVVFFTLTLSSFSMKWEWKRRNRSDPMTFIVCTILRSHTHSSIHSAISCYCFACVETTSTDWKCSRIIFTMKLAILLFGRTSSQFRWSLDLGFLWVYTCKSKLNL